MPVSSIYHNNDNLLDVAGFGGISCQNDFYYNMSRPFNPQQQNRELDNKDDSLPVRSSSPINNCDQYLDDSTIISCPTDDLWEHSSFAARNSCDTTVCTSSQSTCAYDDWNDDLSTCDASVYSVQSCSARIPTPSSSLPAHPSFSSDHGEGLHDMFTGMGSLPPLETLCERSQASESDEDDASDDNPDVELERRITELSLRIATVRGEVDTCSFECRKLANESSKEKRRAEKLRRENEDLRKKIEDLERKAIIEAMDATQGKNATKPKNSALSATKQTTKRGWLFSIKTVNFEDSNEDVDATQTTWSQR
uniref:Uncharacterized protein n=1 Tax=Helicotheca tamesis TaxID=374047 RepID=A0A7S2MR36_9STRA